MWEAFKILLLCIIFIFILTLTVSWLYLSVIFFILIVIFHDFDFSTAIERHIINKFKCSYLKVRNLYATFQSDQNISNFQYTPTMNSINKQSSNLELSRFNKSGNPLSPIVNSSNKISARRLIQSRQTSTPLTRTSPWQKNSLLATTNSVRNPTYNSATSRSPRYSLSSINTPPNSVNDSSAKPTIQTVTGPLLASTRFNVNLGTYTDTQSPGLTSRVVQYHNELSGSQTSTHQSKYGSPGQFPIVQLYKKELPMIGKPSRRCTVRIAPPDPVSYSSDHVNAILRESFVQNNVENTNQQNDSEINTKSVLEALKEISRKRIHTNDDLEDISKRQRKNSVSSTNNSTYLNKDGKRMREETPPKPKEGAAILTNNAPKKICVVNEIESSLSSSRLMRLQQGQKRKSTLNTPESNKQRRISNGKLVSKETQTTITNDLTSNSTTSPAQTTNRIPQRTSTAAQTESEVDSPLLDAQKVLENVRTKKKQSEVKTIRDIDEENSTLHFAKNNYEQSDPIFNEAPLEIMKKNKLAVMLSALGGHEPKIIPLPDLSLSALKRKSEDKVDNQTKEVVSILSPKNKIKHDKHVTFSIPNSEKSNNEVSVSNTSEVVSSKAESLPEKTTSISSPVLNFSAPISFPKQNIDPVLTSTENNFVFGVSTSKVSTASNAITTTTVSTNIVVSSVENCAESKKNDISSFKPLVKSPFANIPEVQFSSLQLPLKTTTSTPISFVPLPLTTSSLNQNANISVPQSSAVTTAALSPAGIFNFPAKSEQKATVVSSAPSLSFTSLTSQNQPKTGGFKFDFGKSNALSPKSADLKKSESVTFLGNQKTQTLAATTVSGMFGIPSTTISSGAFGGSNTASTTAAFAVSNSSTIATFGVANSSNPPPAFGATSSTFSTVKSTESAPSFNAFGSVTSAPAFASTAVAKQSSFGSFPVTTQSNTFGNAVTTTTSGFTFANSTTKPFTFGSNSTTTTTAANLFGGNVATTTTSAPLFGANSNTTTTAPSMFGTNTVITTTAAPIFGANTNTTITTAPPMFGSNTMSNVITTTATMFGANSNPTTAAPPMFGSNTNPTTAPPMFGSNTKTTTASLFGTSNTNLTTNPVTTASTMFGAVTTPSSTNLFGGNTSGFGSTSGPSNTFGTPATTTAQNSFNPQSSGVFNTASVFSPNSNNNSGFGGSANVFGATNQPQNNNFGSSSGFGMNNQSSGVFGTTNTSNSFGTSSFGFGGFSAPPQQSGVFAFGGPNQTAPAAPSTSSTFQFNAGSTAAKQSGFKAFEAGAAPSFGAGSSGFGTPTLGQFNPPAPSNNMFSIGSGSTAPKQRPIIKARRRN